MRTHAEYQLREVLIWFKRYILHQVVDSQPALYSYRGPKTYVSPEIEA